MKYVLVHWNESNETSILSEECVKDKSMLKNPDKEGMVMFGDAKMKAPQNGWNSYLAKVLAASGECPASLVIILCSYNGMRL